MPAELGYLHVGFRRQNPTTLRDDFTIVDGLAGPGRFLGCNVGVRVLDPCDWYGEGEVKVYRDGDDALPTICGTGLEDYVGSAWARTTRPTEARRSSLSRPRATNRSPARGTRIS